jgi:hypothetical protein
MRSWFCALGDYQDFQWLNSGLEILLGNFSSQRVVGCVPIWLVDNYDNVSVAEKGIDDVDTVPVE